MKNNRILLKITLFLLLILMSVYEHGHAAFEAAQGISYSRGDEESIGFPFQFYSVPVVITSAVTRAQAVAVCAVDVTRDNFKLAVTDHKGSSVSDAVVNWIAFVLDTHNECDGEYVQTRNSPYRFTAPRFSQPPIIFTNAVKNGKALISYGKINDRGDVTITITDHNNEPVNNASAVWAAIVPHVHENGFYGREEFLSSYARPLLDTSFETDSTYLVTSGGGTMGGSIQTQRNTFCVLLTRYDGSAVRRNVPVQWLGFAGVPKPGAVTISSEPVGASIFIDYRPKGKTNITVHNLDYGSHSLEVTKLGFKDILRDIEVKIGHRFFE